MSVGGMTVDPSPGGMVMMVLNTGWFGLRCGMRLVDDLYC